MAGRRPERVSLLLRHRQIRRLHDELSAADDALDFIFPFTDLACFSVTHQDFNLGIEPFNFTHS